jgi:hypothetical protein
VIVGRGGSTFENCRDTKKLGYISLDSNSRSNYQARELKVRAGREERSESKNTLDK